MVEQHEPLLNHSIVCYSHGMLKHAPAPIVIEGFTGPFELLARLIERRELDVLTISLAEVTDQYLDHLATLRLRDPEHLTAFLVVAAKLLLIKSSLLLPTRARPTTDESGPADPTDLTARLREYQKFRLAAQWLGTREDADLRSYSRPPVPYRPAHPRRTEPLDPLLVREAFRRALARPKAEPAPVPLASEPRLSVGEALALLRAALGERPSIRFEDLLGADAPRHVRVALFLAVLEARRLGIVEVAQDAAFGEIAVMRTV